MRRSISILPACNGQAFVIRPNSSATSTSGALGFDAVKAMARSRPRGRLSSSNNPTPKVREVPRFLAKVVSVLWGYGRLSKAIVIINLNRRFAQAENAGAVRRAWRPDATKSRVFRCRVLLGSIAPTHSMILIEK